MSEQLYEVWCIDGLAGNNGIRVGDPVEERSGMGMRVRKQWPAAQALSVLFRRAKMYSASKYELREATGELDIYGYRDSDN